MAELQLKLNEVKEVVVTASSGNLRPNGVDFPNGTKWRKPVVLHRPPAPVANCHYSRGDEQSSGSEHTGADSFAIDTPRWHDQITTILNMPTDWGHDAQLNFDEVDVDYSAGSSSSTSSSATFIADKSIRPALWCITAQSVTTSKYTATMEIYNPSCRNVSWDICNSSGTSVGASIVSGWSSSATSRRLDAKSRVTITISCSPAKLFPNNTYRPGSVGSTFYIKFTDMWEIYRTNSSVYRWGSFSEDYARLPMGTTSQSEGFSFLNYASGLQINKLSSICCMPVEIRTIPVSSTQVQPYITIQNPFSVGINYTIYSAGAIGSAEQEQEIFWGSVPANTTRTTRIDLMNSSGEVTSNYRLGTAMYYKFVLGWTLSSKPAISQMNTKRTTAVALPREVYPPVIYRYDSQGSLAWPMVHQGAGTSITLRICNPNPFTVVFNGSVTTSDTTVSYTWPGGSSSTFTLEARQEKEITLNFTKNYVASNNASATIECSGYFEAKALPEDKTVSGTSRKESWKRTISSLHNPPIISAVTWTHGSATFTIRNPNTYTINCKSTLRSYIPDYWINPDTGREEDRGYDGYWHTVLTIPAGGTATVNYASDTDSGFSPRESGLSVQGYTEDRLPTSASYQQLD